MIADDLTGACDGAVAFAKQGFDTRILLESRPQARSDSELTVVSTNSRDDSPARAVAKVAEACRWMGERGISVLFKKIDSVLRGHVEAEVETVMSSCGFESAVMTPAFPAVGRSVRNGELWVFGSKGARGGDLGTMFRRTPSVKVEDAGTDDDLLAIAREALRQRPLPLIVGSGGLADGLAKVLAASYGRTGSVPCAPRSTLPPWVVIGSDHPSTLAQLEHLQRVDASTASSPSGTKVARLLEVPAKRFNAATLQPVVDAIERSEAGSLVVSGGDTARLLCNAIGAGAIRLGGEILAGVPWGRIEGGCADGMTIVTKSGGFGEHDALTRVVSALQEEGPE
jgi:uncharacterized protein YgbK (DUF1537 family)